MASTTPSRPLRLEMGSVSSSVPSAISSTKLMQMTCVAPVSYTHLNVLEVAIRPTSLCMRLFGNVLGAFVIMELIKLVRCV